MPYRTVHNWLLSTLIVYIIGCVLCIYSQYADAFHGPGLPNRFFFLEANPIAEGKDNLLYHIPKGLVNVCNFTMFRPWEEGSAPVHLQCLPVSVHDNSNLQYSLHESSELTHPRQRDINDENGICSASSAYNGWQLPNTTGIHSIPTQTCLHTYMNERKKMPPFEIPPPEECRYSVDSYIPQHIRTHGQPVSSQTQSHKLSQISNTGQCKMPVTDSTHGNIIAAFKRERSQGGFNLPTNKSYTQDSAGCPPASGKRILKQPSPTLLEKRHIAPSKRQNSICSDPKFREGETNESPLLGSLPHLPAEFGSPWYEPNSSKSEFKYPQEVKHHSKENSFVSLVALGHALYRPSSLKSNEHNNFLSPNRRRSCIENISHRQGNTIHFRGHGKTASCDMSGLSFVENSRDRRFSKDIVDVSDDSCSSPSLANSNKSNNEFQRRESTASGSSIHSFQSMNGGNNTRESSTVCAHRDMVMRRRPHGLVGKPGNHSKKTETKSHFIEFVKSQRVLDHIGPNDEKVYRLAPGIRRIQRKGADSLHSLFNEHQKAMTKAGRRREIISSSTAQTWFKRFFPDTLMPVVTNGTRQFHSPSFIQQEEDRSHPKTNLHEFENCGGNLSSSSPGEFGYMSTNDSMSFFPTHNSNKIKVEWDPAPGYRRFSAPGLIAWEAHKAQNRDLWESGSNKHNE